MDTDPNTNLFALIVNGAVANITHAPPDWPGHEGETWVDITTISPPPQIPWVYDGKAFAPPAQGASKAALGGMAGGYSTAFTDSEVEANVGTDDAPIIASAFTSDKGSTDVIGLLALYDQGVKAEGDTTTWFQSTGNLELTKAQLIKIGTSVGAYRAKITATWQTVMAGIASGSITTGAEVEQAFISAQDS